MRFLESLRLWSPERHRRRVNLPHSHNSQPVTGDRQTPRWSEFVNSIWRLVDTISDTFATTPTRHVARLNAYIWPRSHPWPPYSPSPALAQRLHGYAAVHIFTVIYLPYAFIVSVVTMIVAIGLRVGFPNGWRFSIALGVCGWVPTMLLVGLCAVLRTKIRMAREVAWAAWGAEVDRRILEFESLHGRAREDEIEAFMYWVRGGEGLGNSPVAGREPDEESAIGPALTDEEYQTGWGSLRQEDGGRGSDDPDEEGWNMHGTVLRELHMTVHWRQNADDQERAHREAQEVARLRNHVANTVAAETSSHSETMVRGDNSAVKVAEEPLLDINLSDDDLVLSSTSKNDESKSVISVDNVEKEEEDYKVNTS
ncbi:hypothetical protein GMDG_04657 [Pseudogymnoascus destructans 20631-21]|uniref:Uncharacterized protein n=1 Tax=Pseudogymnoascus destructans (strain ATCC MYA-4855 / 20631-21) TaxID=658429 RepID=L8GDS0_PSED2|nr:hypothetical protein GMDG_04657 [Pseudogymnoascus destructans 20631-21]